MPSGAKKRKAAKKRKVQNNPTSSSTTHSHHGESDGGELSSPASQDHHSNQHPFAKEDAPENESVTIESTEKAAMKEEGNIEIDRGSKSKSKSMKSSESSSSSSSFSSDDESNVTELVQSVESLPEKITQKVEDLTVETSKSLPEKITQKYEDLTVETAIVDPIEPVESLIEEVSLGYNDMKNEENRDLVVEVDNSLTFEQKVNESDSKLTSMDVKVSSESKNNGADCVNVSETPEHSERQPLVASAPQAVQTTSWKSCCGMLELFSGSNK